jgi:hypothetical protein
VIDNAALTKPRPKMNASEASTLPITSQVSALRVALPIANALKMNQGPAIQVPAIIAASNGQNGLTTRCASAPGLGSSKIV